MSLPNRVVTVISLAAWALLGLAAPAPVCQDNLNFAHPVVLDPAVNAKVISNGLSSPRHIVFDSAPVQNLLVASRGTGLVALVPGGGGCSGWQKRVILENTGLNHGIAYDSGPPSAPAPVLYASSRDVAYRWKYDPSTTTVDTSSEQVIVKGMANPDHDTRPLMLWPPTSPQYIYISRGSAANLDATAGQISSGVSQIRRFSLASIPSGGYSWSDGEVVAWGLRNSVGFAMDRSGTQLWQVENSADQLTTPKYGDVHQDNPAEELNMIDLTKPLGKNYGYPNCFTYWDVSTATGAATGPKPLPRTGSQFSIHPTIADSWCNDPANSVGPRLSFQAHSAPLDIKFFDSTNAGLDKCSMTAEVPGLNCNWRGHAFVTFHGSWNRNPPTGYKLVRIPWSFTVTNPASGQPLAAADSKTGYVSVLSTPDTTQCPGGCIRPVGLAFDKKGRLFMSSDATGEIVMITSKAVTSNAT